MGLLQDVSTLALASIVRETATTNTGSLAELFSRLNAPGGDLIRQLTEINLRAWQAWEIMLLGPELFAHAGAQTAGTSEQATAYHCLGAAVQAFSARVLPALGRRIHCATVLQAFLASGQLTAEPLEVGVLIHNITRLAALDDLAFAREEARLFGDLARHMLENSLIPLVELHTAVGVSESFFVVSAACTFLRRMVERDPQRFWGPNLVRDEGTGENHFRALLAVDELQVHHPSQLDQWLRGVSDSALFLRTRETSIDLEVHMERVVERRLPPVLAPGAPPPVPSAPAMPAPTMALPPRSGVHRAIAKSEVAEEEEEPTAKKDLRRRASIRWYRRMNPQRMYPLTVALSKGRIKEVSVKGVAQAVSAEMLVVSESNPFITIRPVLPGVLVYPPEQTVDVSSDLVTVRFQVLPQMLGEVADARIEFYWRQRLLSKVDLPVKVKKQTLALVASFTGLLWPFLGSTVKSLGVGEEEPKDFVMRYLTAFLNWPHAIEVGLAVTSLLAVLFYWLNRPRASSEETNVLGVKPMSLEELLAEGRRLLLQEKWDEARSYFEDAVNVAPTNPEAANGLEQAQSRRRIPTEIN